ncbi:MAG TPA: AAA family ATPase [Phycisphaerae bacterium]|nr:AAA family ATPase [Phycisphaerae bacterium]HRR83632.1 AAA family ATPase [Phycisphaerae bacterium]
MRQSVRVIVFNADEEYSAALRADLLSIPGVQIVAEVDEATLIEQAVTHFPAEVVVIHLDPMPEALLPVASSVASNHPEIAVFVVTSSTDGQYVLAAMRAGVKEFITKPVDRQLVATALDKVLAQNESAHERGVLISVMGTIGGSGASTVATNLAVELAEFAKKKPVAIVDLDFRFGQLSTMLDLQPDYTIADLCDTPEKIDAGVIEKAMVRHNTGIHVLARPNHFSEADQITAAHCVAVLSSLQQMYEYVVVDGPSRYDPGGLAVLDMADMNLLIMQLLVTSVRNVHRMLDELRAGGYNMDRFHLICNRVERDSNNLEISHVEETLKKDVAHQLPDDWKTVSTAINMGVSLKEYSAKSRIRLALRELARRIAQPENADEAHENGGKGGLFSRLLNAV